MSEPIVCAHGGGTNSQAALIALRNKGVVPDVILFADTGDEKPHTYNYLDLTNAWCKKNNFPEITIVRGDQPQQLKDGSLSEENYRLGVLPAKAYGSSACSHKWKIEPQERWLKRNGFDAVTKVIGYDADEPERKERALATVQPHKLMFPLIENNWGRQECVKAIREEGLPQPLKSACFHCPSSKKWEILDLHERYPSLLDRALEIERRALAGEGDGTFETTCAGLGRTFNWREFVVSANAAGITSQELKVAQQSQDAKKRFEKRFTRNQLDMFYGLFTEAGTPEVCGSCIG
jgi:3'-phosphoadenosine 5'-phosphosulfate sulfotransferase (PAPS reductase)/FAD synthetase